MAGNFYYNYQLKFIIIGVGKSCLLFQFTDKKFRSEIDSTIGVEFGTKIVQIKDANVKLSIWDTAGQESFRSITRSYYRGSICAIIVYDVSSQRSFDNVKSWLEETKKQSSSQIQCILIGNKCDLIQDREVTYHQGETFAKTHGISFLETSAKTGQNTFICMTEKIVQMINTGVLDINNESIGIKRGSVLQIQQTNDNKGKDKCQC